MGLTQGYFNFFTKTRGTKSDMGLALLQCGQREYKPLAWQINQGSPGKLTSLLWLCLKQKSSRVKNSVDLKVLWQTSSGLLWTCQLWTCQAQSKVVSWNGFRQATAMTWSSKYFDQAAWQNTYWRIPSGHFRRRGSLLPNFPLLFGSINWFPTLDEFVLHDNAAIIRKQLFAMMLD